MSSAAFRFCSSAALRFASSCCLRCSSCLLLACLALLLALLIGRALLILLLLALLVLLLALLVGCALLIVLEAFVLGRLDAQRRADTSSVNACPLAQRCLRMRRSGNASQSSQVLWLGRALSCGVVSCGAAVPRRWTVARIDGRIDVAR